jgi:branched-chain amino acid transport system substrate-binding protein
MKNFVRTALGVAAGCALAASAVAADLKVGLSVSLSGPNASLGVPYAKGMQAAIAYRPEIAGRKVVLTVLDDASDPTTAGRNARKLIRRKVGAIMGTSAAGRGVAMAQVSRETKTPMIGPTPIGLPRPMPVAVHRRQPTPQWSMRWSRR